ncbi:MAG: transcriptional regulator [Ferruginibacter sp.]|nr:transcriptional regulator [Ferruginibacter sp.]
MRRDVFQAIADPTRRDIIHLLASQSLNLNAVAEKFTISRPAISKHIKILTECGLITIRTEGRERYCEVKLEALQQVLEWIDQYNLFWTGKLDTLALHLSNPSKSNNIRTPKKNEENGKSGNRITKTI